MPCLAARYFIWYEISEFCGISACAVPAFDIVLPVGISFYTFQALSYVIDVYRKEEPAEKNFLQYALYVSFFPTILSGPIERSKNLLMQIRQQKRLNPEKIVTGLLIMAFGYFQKLIIAGRASVMVDHVYQNPDSSSALQILLAVFLFSIQIYCDFGGYSMLALGAAKVLGFDLTENFRQPYLAVSIQDFWRRWHISLSTWFRDYLYIPLGGSRSGNVYLNLLLVFLATGIWHGAAWGFLLWGLWHGFFVLLERFWVNHGKQKVRSGIAAKVFGWLYTMLVVVIGWVLFSLVQLDQVLTYLGIMFGKNAGGFHAYGLRYYLSNQMIFYLIVSVLVCIPWKWKKPEGLVFDVLQKILILGLLVLCFVFIINSSYNPFIYFRF